MAPRAHRSNAVGGDHVHPKPGPSRRRAHRAGAGRRQPGRSRAADTLRCPHRRRPEDRAAGLDARAVPQDAAAADFAARALRGGGHAARGQLDQPGAVAQAQGDPGGQGAGRSRPRPLPLFRGGDARQLARRDDRCAARGPRQILVHLQLPDAVVGGRGRDRLAGRRRGHHEPGAAVPVLVWAVCARHDPHLQGGIVPPAPGLRIAADHDARHPGPARPGAGRRQPLVVPGADDVRPARQRLAQQRADHGLGHQAHFQRRPAPALHRRHRRAGARAGRDAARPRPPVERRARPLRLLAAGLDRVQAGAGRPRPCNRERLATRQRAHDEGEWGREAALAHARKRAAHNATPAAPAAPTEQAA